ncbi:MAG: bis-aminopropyl spermidine synthase family protein [Candidatus Bathyarchaeia archaeon]
MDKIKALILRELAASRRSVWELLEAGDFLLRDFIRAANELYEGGLIEAGESGLGITEKGLSALDEAAVAFKSGICDKCSGRRVIPGGGFGEIFNEYKGIVANRPPPNPDFCQGYMDEYDVIARAALMHHYDDLSHKDVVLIGDDDLLSIALALTGLPHRICVLDVDERLGDFIAKVNGERGFGIEFRKYDVRDPLPKDLLEGFDVFSSEPLETLSGLRAFISRGACCLREGGSGYFGLTVAEASHGKWLEIERFVTGMNCVITDIIRGFSRYPTAYGGLSYEGFARGFSFPVAKNPGIRWYKSALFRFEALGKPIWAIPPDERIQMEQVDPEEDVTIIYRD